MAAKPSTKSTTKRNTKRPPAPVAETTSEMSGTTSNEMATVQTRTPSHGEIAQRAYELFLARGRQHGRAQEDWLSAERELHARFAVN
jgi:hypothetical protein